MNSIVVITTPGSQKRDFANELTRRTKSVSLVVVQLPKKRPFLLRIKGFVRKVSLLHLPWEAMCFFLSRTKKNRALLQSVKSFTPFRRDQKEYVAQTIFVDDVNSDEVAEKIEAIRPKVIAIWGGMIVKDRVLRHADIAVNLHAGICPYYRGSNGNFHALLQGEKEKVGFTVHTAVPEVDAGDILSIIPGNPALSREAFFRDLNDKAAETYIRTIDRLLRGEKVERKKQDLMLGHNYLLREWTYQKNYTLIRKVLSQWS